MKKRMFSLLIATILILPACGVFNPQSNDEYSELTPIAVVVEEADNIIPKEYENLTFRQDKISISVPEDLACCTLREVGCFDLDYGDKLMRWWIPSEVWDDQYVSAWDDTYAYAFSSIFDRTEEDGNGWYAAVWCTGTVTYAREKGWEHFFHTPEGLDRSYNVNVDNLNESISLDGEDVTLSSVLDLANSFASDWLAQTDLQITLRPKYLYVCSDQNMEKFVQVIYQTCWNGVPISTVTRQYPDSKMFTLPVPSEQNGYTGDVEMLSVLATTTSGNDLDFFGGGNGAVELYDAGTVYENMVSLSTACDILSESITGYGTQEIRDVALEYRFNIVGSDQPQNTYRFIDEKSGELLPDRGKVQLYRTSYDLYEATPYWAFYGNDKRFCELVFYVNCLTGEVQVIDNQP